MKHFVLGVLVGATGMGLYTGHIQVNIDRLKNDADRVKNPSPAVPPRPPRPPQ